MITRMVEIRDRNTFVPALAILVEDENEAQRYYMRRTGYPTHGDPLPTIILMRFSDQRANSDQYDWNDRTHKVAHNHLYDLINEAPGYLTAIERFKNAIPDGLVIDVEYILGETTEPKRSEREL